MKNRKLALLISLFALSSAAAVSAQETTAASDGTQTQQPAPGRTGHKKHRGLRLGVCVGQTLAGEGITLPAPQPGVKPSWDAATQTAFRAAIQSCRAQFQAARESAKASSTN